MNDRYDIVPHGIQPGAALVRDFDFQVRTLLDYDVNYLQDRVRAEVFANGKPVGVYSSMRVEVGMGDSPASIIARFGPDLERSVIDEFVGNGYRRKVVDLEREVADLKAYINRPRWFHARPVRRAVRRFFDRLGRIIVATGRPLVDDSTPE